MKNKKGILMVISGPSGAGKGTVCKALLQKRDDVVLSVSATSRNPRPGEVDGVHYFFLSEQAFREKIDAGQMLEHAVFCGNYYGTPKAYVDEMLAAGKNVILEIEVQGAMHVRSKYPEGVYIFILPPSMQELENRLVGRGTEKEDVVRERLERAKRELDYINKYNYVVVNEDVDKAADEICAVIDAERCRLERNIEFIEEVFVK